MTLMVGDPCEAVERHGASVVLHLKSGAIVNADRLLVATGRRPNVEAWRESGLAQTERGWLKVDPATLEAHADVYGAGDVTGLGGFTHLAYYHGRVIARRLRGEDARADHSAVPRVTFTDPEVASVGLSEAAATERGLDVVVAGADPAEAARGYIHDFHGGALKLVADRKRGVLVGATMVTPRAGEILGELVLAVKVGTPVRDLADVIHPFPAFNRVLGAALGELAAKLKRLREIGAPGRFTDDAFIVCKGVSNGHHDQWSDLHPRLGHDHHLVPGRVGRGFPRESRRARARAWVAGR